MQEPVLLTQGDSGQLKRIDEDQLVGVLELLAQPDQHEREKFLKTACDLWGVSSKVVALCWIYDPAKSKLMITHWAQPGRTPVPYAGTEVSLNHGSPAGIEDQILEFLGPATPQAVQDWARDNGFGANRSPVILWYPKDDSDCVRPSVAHERLLGVIQFFSHDPFPAAPPALLPHVLNSMVASIVRRREARLRETVDRVMQELDDIVTPGEFLNNTAQTLSNGLFADLVLIFRYGRNLGLELVASYPPFPGHRFEASPNSILHEVAKHKKSIRVRDIQDDHELIALRGNNGRDMNALAHTRLLLNTGKGARPDLSQLLNRPQPHEPRSWMAAPVTTRGDKNTIAVVLAVQKNRPPAVEFTPHDEKMLLRVCDLLGGVLPRVDTHEALRHFATADFFSLVDDKPNAAFYDLLSMLIPGTAAAAVFRPDHSGEAVRLIPIGGAPWFTTTQPPFRDDLTPFGLGPNRWGVATPIGSHNSSLVLGLVRDYITGHERDVIEFIAAGLRHSLHTFLTQQAQIKQITEMRHAIKTGLTGALGHCHIAIQAFESIRSGNELHSELESSRLRKSMFRTYGFLRKAATLSEESRYLLGTINAATLKRGTHNVWEVLRDLRMSLSSAAERREIKIELINRCIDRCPAEFDLDLIGIMLFNVIENAVKYSFRKKTIFVELSADRYEWTVDVTDEGIEIPPDDRENIFKPFVRRPTGQAALSRPGSGLGLAVAKEVAAAHRGRISVRSDNIRGGGESAARTTFSISIPR